MAFVFPDEIMKNPLLILYRKKKNLTFALMLPDILSCFYSIRCQSIFKYSNFVRKIGLQFAFTLGSPTAKCTISRKTSCLFRAIEFRLPYALLKNTADTL